MELVSGIYTRKKCWYKYKLILEFKCKVLLYLFSPLINSKKKNDKDESKSQVMQWRQLWFIPRFFLLKAGSDFLWTKQLGALVSCAFCCTQRAARCSLLYLQPRASSSCKSQGNAGQRWPNTQQPGTDFTMIITVSMMLSLCPLFVCPAWINWMFPYFCVSLPQCRVHSWTQKMHRGYKNVCTTRVKKLLFLHVDI